ncbi:Pre-mRNA-splicing factor Cwf15/Cwc15 [Mycena pura]|uniref:Pre-mRNA-splicing factor Cwf15/Cwc15 n=1 Tax=Mycena pura TaxID=153505 RepID=A0AAD6V3D1_9AGAR|nr:Pre-mRNA-splicing factor Cwf15/Cwc15 [Mycena pura]
MSTAHRPTWDPAQAKDVKGASRQYSVRDMAMHTKLKFRQVGQTSVAEVKQRDLRAELAVAELEAKNKKRKAEGLPPLALEGATPAPTDEESNKRRKLLQESLALDKDDEDEDADAEDPQDAQTKDKDADADDSDAGSDSDDDDSDDETAELLRELEKIKRERAEEKARQEQEQSAADAATREAEIATSNPLLNLAAALGQPVTGVNTTVPGSFAVKKRWDDDLIFKNQSTSAKEKPTHFVNDLLRTEFHKKFMAKFIKVNTSCLSSRFELMRIAFSGNRGYFRLC